jgi:N-methylhydantoinase A/oxoprolinase/acetone carboxylase beta subunit
VEVGIDGTRVQKDFENPLRETFYRRYEALYGVGAALRGARLELVTFRLRASAETPRPRIRTSKPTSHDISPDAIRGRRLIYWDEAKKTLDTPVYDGTGIKPGNAMVGPAVVETPDTTVVVRPLQQLRMDAFGNFELLMSPQQSNR